MKYQLFGALLLGGVVAGCGANGNSPSAPTTVANITSNVLQFDVGTVNLYGNAHAGLNVVVTYRQPSNGFDPGGSAVLVSSPSMRLPNLIRSAATTGTVAYDPTSTAWSDPSERERGGRLIMSTSQAPGATEVTTFGQSGGAFALGIEPFNALGAGDAAKPPINLYGQPFCPRPSLRCPGPYPVPLYNPRGGTGDPNVFEPWGGPPAFDLLGNGQSPTGNPDVPPGYDGLPMGLDVFLMPNASSGTYGLSVFVATQSNGNVTQNASAHLNASIGLPAASAAKFVANGRGGGALTFHMPGGATEAYIQVTDYGPLGAMPGCNSASNQPASSSSSSSSGGAVPVTVYYTIVARHGGTYNLPDSAGPGGTPSICTGAQNHASNKHLTTGDAFIVQTIAFDYPLYEASETEQVSSHNPSPVIRGPRGQDDVTISPADCEVAPQGSGATTLCPTGTLPFPGQPQ